LHQASWNPNEKRTCNVHKDKHNGRLSQCLFMNGVYQDENGKWICDGAVVYSRKSIDEYEVKLVIHRPYLQGVQRSLDPLFGRCEISADTFQNGDVIPYFEGVSLLKILCNLQVEISYQAFVANCVCLATALISTRQDSQVLCSQWASLCAALGILQQQRTYSWR
jgi:hypothetical protein